MNTPYLEAMKNHWENTLKLTTSQALIDGWLQLQQAVVTASGPDAPWQAIQLPTGAGKTEALKVLCSLPSIHTAGGVLVVTRQISQAIDLAKGINELSGQTLALAVHSEVSVSARQIQNALILVITHSAYSNALCEIAAQLDHQSQWDRVRFYIQAERRVLVIDEAFKWVEGFQVELTELMALSAALKSMPLVGVQASVENLDEFACSMSQGMPHGASDKALTHAQLHQLAHLDIEELIKFISCLSQREVEIWPSIVKSKLAMKQAYIKVLRELQLIQSVERGWLSKRGNRIQINSSRLLLNYAKTGGVILDATAGIDPMYELLVDRVKLLPSPTGVRSYHNVTLHVSAPCKTGKGYLTKHSDTYWPSLLDAVNKRVGPKNKTLVICHQDVEKTLSLRALESGHSTKAHWGDIDGKNKWKDFDHCHCLWFAASGRCKSHQCHARVSSDEDRDLVFWEPRVRNALRYG